MIASFGSAVVIRQVLLQRLDARIDSELRQEISEITALAEGNDPETGQSFGEDVLRIFEVFIDRNVPAGDEVFHAYMGGQLVVARAGQSAMAMTQEPGLQERWSRIDRPSRGSMETDMGRVEYVAVPFLVGETPVGVFAVGLLRDLRESDTDAAIVAVATVALLVAVIGSLLAVRLADHILRPVREVASTAQSISERDLSERISVRGHDEIADLATTFNEMLDRLDGAFKTQRRFIDDASHELRTPITIIQGHLDLMGDDPEERDRTLALVNEELDRVRRLIGDLLTLAKSEHPEFLQPQAVDVEELTRSVFEKARGLGDREWRFGGSALLVASLDRQRMTQALLQLSENAVRHTEDGEPVELGSAVERSGLVFWVRDHGQGVAAEDRARIFERFYRGRDSRRQGGSGLGLSIVKAIAEAHGGGVQVEGPADGGARFVMTIPLDRTEART